MADENAAKAEACRTRAKEIMKQIQGVQDETRKRTLQELADAWLELARRAEEKGNG
ncbi:MAG TPA: hypothetical protein VNW15_00090 [Rhizomicrobium sp.]|nr:hypothetical protein [Rhizomicrobium sp.]